MAAPRTDSLGDSRQAAPVARGRARALPSWEEMLRAVLQGHAPVELVAQPVVDLRSGHVAGYELLSRFGWPFTAGDLAATPPPDMWFAAAARLGMAEELTEMVLGAAHRMRQSLPTGVWCSVNIEPAVLGGARVARALSGDLSGVVVELTEHDRTAVDPDLVAVLDGLRERGALIAVDDTGSGYAGLAHVLAVRPEVVKLDRRLVAGLDGDPARRDLVNVVLDLARRLDAVLVAEGVETPAECEVLVGLGVPLGQGWLLGRPGPPWPHPAAEVSQLIRAGAGRVRAGGSVAGLVRPPGPATADLLDRGDPPQAWVVLDGRSRPHTVVVREPGVGLVSAPAFVVAVDTPVEQALGLALAREDGWRWAPLAAVDGRGRSIGWIDVGDLVHHLLVAGAPRPPVPRHEPAGGPVPLPRSG